MGDSHNDFLFVNEALGFSADFSNLQLVESRYRWPAGVGRYEQLLQEADSKIDWRYRIARWMLRVADDFMLKRDTGALLPATSCVLTSSSFYRWTAAACYATS